MLLSTSDRAVHEMPLLDYNACNAKFCTPHKFHSAFNPRKKKSLLKISIVLYDFDR